MKKQSRGGVSGMDVADNFATFVFMLLDVLSSISEAVKGRTSDVQELLLAFPDLHVEQFHLLRRFCLLRYDEPANILGVCAAYCS